MKFSVARMGIKFHCPNGHKLNVKSFLAGKRGICPHCGARVNIPHESVAELVPQKTESSTGQVAPGAPDSLDEPASPGESSVVPSTLAVDITPQIDTVSAPCESKVLHVHAGPVDSGAPSNATRDPIAEAPGAAWYVRPPSGGQFGPASGDVMSQWISEGRVGPESLVWREGWTDWRPAGPLFPQLSPGVSPPPVPSIPTAIVAATEAANIAVVAPRKTFTRRQGPSGLAIAVVVILGVMSVLLLVVFILVATGTFSS